MSKYQELNGIKQSIIDKFTLNVGLRIRKDRVARTYGEMGHQAWKMAKLEADVQYYVLNERVKSAVRNGQIDGDTEKFASSFDYVDYFNQRREYHMSQMFRILEITKGENGESETNEKVVRQDRNPYRESFASEQGKNGEGR